MIAIPSKSPSALKLAAKSLGSTGPGRLNESVNGPGGHNFRIFIWKTRACFLIVSPPVTTPLIRTLPLDWTSQLNLPATKYDVNQQSRNNLYGKHEYRSGCYEFIIRWKSMDFRKKGKQDKDQLRQILIEATCNWKWSHFHYITIFCFTLLSTLSFIFLFLVLK